MKKLLPPLVLVLALGILVARGRLGRPDEGGPSVRGPDAVRPDVEGPATVAPSVGTGGADPDGGRVTPPDAGAGEAPTGSDADPRAGQSRSELEATYRQLEIDLRAERRRLFDGSFERGEYVVHRTEDGLLPPPPRGPDGVEAEVAWRRAEDARGEDVLHVATLAFAEHAEYYGRVAERNRLRARLGLPSNE